MGAGTDLDRRRGAAGAENRQRPAATTQHLAAGGGEQAVGGAEIQRAEVQVGGTADTVDLTTAGQDQAGSDLAGDRGGGRCAGRQRQAKQ
ncbi:hypothetical protein D3C75_1179400 [compost metagenome]